MFCQVLLRLLESLCLVPRIDSPVDLLVFRGCLSPSAFVTETVVVPVPTGYFLRREGSSLYSSQGPPLSSSTPLGWASRPVILRPSLLFEPWETSCFRFTTSMGPPATSRHSTWVPTESRASSATSRTPSPGPSPQGPRPVTHFCSPLLKPSSWSLSTPVTPLCVSGPFPRVRPSSLRVLGD